jgi:hypothetical protein
MASIKDPAKADPPPSTGEQFREGPHEFSLVLGGPLFQLLRRTRIYGDHMELLNRRIIAAVLITWFPLLLLSGLSSGGLHSFLHDVEVHVRFLIALPCLIIAELLANSRLRPVTHRFVERRIVPPQDVPRFDSAIESAIRLRNSNLVEICLFILVYTFGPLLWNSRVPVIASTWYAQPGGRWNLTPAGYLYVFVSIPIVQFILLRWYLRFFIWYRFLWQVSRLKLNLISTHPDRCAGLAFLGKSAYAFAPILFAQGTLLAGVVASRVLYRGENLKSFKMQIFGFVVLFVLAVLGPLLMFSRQMAAAKRKGLADYGQLAQDYVEDFDRKWVAHDPPPHEDILGTGDIQSLADLGNSYSVVSSMRPVPFGLDDITRLAAATVAPFLPLLLTIFPLDVLVMKIVQAVF